MTRNGTSRPAMRARGMRPLVTCALAMTSMLGCSSGIQVDQQYDTVTDFTRYRSYSWIPVTPGNTSGITQQRIKQSINQELVNRGMDPLPSNADLFVTYRVEPWDSKSSTLTIEFVEGESKRVAWRGWAEGGLPDGSSQSTDAAIAGLVTTILAQYPPGAR